MSRSELTSMPLDELIDVINDAIEIGKQRVKAMERR